MILIENINRLLGDKKEKKYLLIIFFGIILTTILETLSIAAIIPVFNIIIFEKLPISSFYKFEDLKFGTNFKILILFIFILIFSFKNIFIIVFNYFFISFLGRLNINMSKRLFSLCLKQDYIFFATGGPKNFLQQVTDDVIRVNIFLLAFINVLIEIIFIAAISFFLLFVNYKIFLFSFFIFFFSILIYFNIFKKRIKNWSISNTEYSGRIKNLVIEGINGIKDLIVYKLEVSFSNSFNIYSHLSNTARSKMDFLNNIQKYWMELVAIFSMTLASIYFIFSNFNINILVPVFGVFVFALFRLLTSFNRIVIGLQNIRFNYPSFISIVKQLESFEASKEISFDNKFQFKSSIELKNVGFSYASGSNKLLKNINLRINKGECIGILGINGSGKSTLLNLVSALIKPSEGSILIDDKYDLFNNRDSWYDRLSYVQQNIFLLDSTIKYNICLVDEDKIDNVKFKKILDDLQLCSFFNSFPDQLNSRVGNNGLILSGGQKQMISLARALYKNSEVIIFDEPSSALDAENTKLLKKNISLLKGYKTIFIVTHDKDFFFDCFDKIIEIDSGKII